MIEPIGPLKRIWLLCALKSVAAIRCAIWSNAPPESPLRVIFVLFTTLVASCRAMRPTPLHGIVADTRPQRHPASELLNSPEWGLATRTYKY